MSLIDNTYLILDANLPASDYSDLDAYIARYEKEILIKLLGYELWKLVDAYDGTPGVITDLVEGKEYTVDDELRKWNGFINDDKKSLIAYYVCCQWIINKHTALQTTGMMKLKSENAENASPALKVVNAWRHMYALYYSCVDFLIENKDDYPTWVLTAIDNLNQFDI